MSRSASALASLAVAVLLLAACESSSVAHPSPSAAPKEPGPRGYAVMLDTPDGIALVGGESAGPRLGGTAFSDIWSFSPGHGWALVAPDAPSVGGRFGIADGVGYHAPAGAFVFLDAASNTWRLDAGHTAWTKQASRGPRQGHGIRLVYDARADRFVAFGGDLSGSASFDETWAYDLARDAWTNRAPSISPPPRSYYAIAYDAKASRLVMFGGVDYETDVGDTWTYSYSANTWTRITTHVSPSPRHYSAMVYDPIRYRMLLFGGAHDAESPLGDTWAFDLRSNTWSELHPSGATPSARAWHAMAFDVESGQAYLYSGGRDRGSFTTELWTFDPRNDTWAKVA